MFAEMVTSFSKHKLFGPKKKKNKNKKLNEKLPFSKKF